MKKDDWFGIGVYVDDVFLSGVFVRGDGKTKREIYIWTESKRIRVERFHGWMQ